MAQTLSDSPGMNASYFRFCFGTARALVSVLIYFVENSFRGVMSLSLAVMGKAISESLAAVVQSSSLCPKKVTLTMWIGLVDVLRRKQRPVQSVETQNEAWGIRRLSKVSLIVSLSLMKFQDG